MYWILVIILIISIIIFGYYELFYKSHNFIKLSYDEVINKIENKESFVLCVSASECTHCLDYKPKLKKVSYDYDIKIYYIDVDKLSEDDYENFKTKLSFDGATPTTIFIKEGEEKTTSSRIDGDVSTEKIINKLKKNGFISQ